MNPDEKHLMEIADQLSCPNGEKGIKTAENMAVNNHKMITLAISTLNLEPVDVVLEIGPGGASHVPAILANSKHLLYYGVDISPLMISEAKRFNHETVATGQADFSLADGEKLNFADDFFSKIFTVNTLYFWKDPKTYLAEILRVLKPDGLFSLAFATKDFMETRPFTKYKFRLYNSPEVEELLTGNGFIIQNITSRRDEVTSNDGGTVNREAIVITTTKPAKA